LTSQNTLKLRECISKDYLNFLDNKNEDINNGAKNRNKMKLLNNLKLTDITGKIINTKDVKIRIIQNILNKKSLPKCHGKWNNVLEIFLNVRFFTKGTSSIG
jgi:hypothetical protein